MSVKIISRYGNFRYHITSQYWDSRILDYRYRIIETGDTFKTERGALRKVNRLMKRKKKLFREAHPDWECFVTKEPIKRRRLKPVNTKNVWVQIIE
jgi:hypothetical protein